MDVADAAASVTLRPLERGDLHFVHVLNNNRSVMGYWFEEPYESFVELEELYRKHIHDQSERRFIVEDGAHERVGLVELVEINGLHRRAEFLIMISPESSRTAATLAPGDAAGDQVTPSACSISTSSICWSTSTTTAGEIDEEPASAARAC